MLPDEDLQAMRETVVESLAGTAVIQTNTWSSDGGGGGSMSWAAAGTFPCRVTPVSSAAEGQVVDGSRLQPDTEYIFTFEAGTEITDDSRILHAGGVFSVTSVRQPRTFEVSRRVEAKEVR